MASYTSTQASLTGKTWGSFHVTIRYGSGMSTAVNSFTSFPATWVVGYWTFA